VVVLDLEIAFVCCADVVFSDVAKIVMDIHEDRRSPKVQPPSRPVPRCVAVTRATRCDIVGGAPPTCRRGHLGVFISTA
jgi:hypothetical protein